MVDAPLMNRLIANLRGYKLVHYYEKIEPEQVLSITRECADDFTDFASCIEAWMASGTG